MTTVHCPMCGCELLYLVRSPYSDSYLARCPCVGFALGTREMLKFEVGIDFRVPPLPKRLRGWHGRWTAIGMRGRAQRWQEQMRHYRPWLR